MPRGVYTFAAFSFCLQMLTGLSGTKVASSTAVAPAALSQLQSPRPFPRESPRPWRAAHRER
jgi:hypothetical protein